MNGHLAPSGGPTTKTINQHWFILQYSSTVWFSFAKYTQLQIYRILVAYKILFSFFQHDLLNKMGFECKWKKIGIAEIVLYPMSVNGQVGRKIKRRSGKKVGERVEIFPGGGWWWCGVQGKSERESHAALITVLEPKN